MLGLEEVPKPPTMAGRGGLWLRLGEIELHLGVDPDFRPAGKAHPGLHWDGVVGLAEALTAVGHEIRWDEGIPGRRRFHTLDPFGNRLEFLEDA